ncbi:MAG: amidohydrolase family protein [Acidimicrobiales bacterium]|nr:amidohydrolase family protein [Acidimicrobiales bacterium]
MTTSPSTAVRDGLDHPVVDADGHLVEIPAVFCDYLDAAYGPEMVDRLHGDPFSHPLLAWAEPEVSPERARALRIMAPVWWGNPGNALDRATARLPALLNERLPELGIDFAIVYPGLAFLTARINDPELRHACVRSMNTYWADATRPYAERMTMAAVIPMQTPSEAIAELEHCVTTLGYKAASFGAPVPRPYTDADGTVVRPGTWLDLVGLDSAHDYDPLWQRCVELGISPTFHSGSLGGEYRSSVSTYVHNHIGHFTETSNALSKAFFLGGVTHRFPTLRFGFLEGGAAGGVTTYAALVERWNKRGGPNIGRLDPDAVDWARFDELVATYGDERVRQPDVVDFLHRTGHWHPENVDDFWRCELDGAADIKALYAERFFFGCEADDRMNGLAFAEHLNPFGARIGAMLGSDIGHWDVADMTAVVAEAHELVDDGLMTPENFRSFACDNAIALHASTNPAFFDGTAVADYARGALTR